MATSCDECDESDVIPKRRSDAEQGPEETTYCCCCTFAKDFGKPGKTIGCGKKQFFTIVVYDCCKNAKVAVISFERFF